MLASPTHAVAPASSVLMYYTAQLSNQQKESCLFPAFTAKISELTFIGPTWITCPSLNQSLCLGGRNMLISQAKLLTHSYMGVCDWELASLGSHGLGAEESGLPHPQTSVPSPGQRCKLWEGRKKRKMSIIIVFLFQGAKIFASSGITYDFNA